MVSVSPDAAAAQDGDTGLPFEAELRAAAEASDMPFEVLAGVMWAESRGNPGEPGGGLMQLTPEEFDKQKRKHPDLIRGDMDDPASNAMALAFELKDLTAEYGDIETALRVYNAGPEGLNDPGAGDPAYVENVQGFAQAIDAGQPLPP
jgi:soluble lytic murein transglycosylase-like protein